MRVLGLLAAAALIVLAGCSSGPKAPETQGVCWHMVDLGKGKVKFNTVAEHVDSIEKCAAEIEAMRLRFLGLGGSNRDIIGAYQGQFLFFVPEGIFTSGTLNGGRYLLLVRTGDGRLAKPGELPPG